jgi:hypothetical protein
MKHRFTLLALLVVLCAQSISAAVILDNPKVKLIGFMQTLAVLDEDNDALTFGMDRIRLAVKADLSEQMTFKLHFDFMKTDTDVDADGDSPGIIKDAVVGLKFKGGVFLLGKEKTAAGYEFNFPGYKLDVIKRGFGHQNMIFERNVGFQYRSGKIGAMKTSFKVGLYNAGPKKATDTGDPAEGQDYTFSSAIYTKLMPQLTAHASFGTAMTSVDGQEAVSLLGVALDYKSDKFRTVVDFMARDDADHAGSDGSTYYGMACYKVQPTTEVVVRYETLDVENDANDRADVVAGINYYFNPKKPWLAKIMFNYVSSDMDGKSGPMVMFQGVF